MRWILFGREPRRDFVSIDFNVQVDLIAYGGAGATVGGGVDKAVGVGGTGVGVGVGGDGVGPGTCRLTTNGRKLACSGNKDG